MQSSEPNFPSNPSRGNALVPAGWRGRLPAAALALSLPLLPLSRARAEDHVDYRYEYYQEDDNRIAITTHSALFDVALNPHIELKGEVVFDSISGATPTGAAPAHKYFYLPELLPPTGNTNNTAVPLTEMKDFRWSAMLEPTFTFGRHHLTPQVSYSHESDYGSLGTALNYSVDFNDKNTTLNLGWSRSTDQSHDDLGKWRDKVSDDFLVGVTQLLGPKTLLTLNFTFGNASGYMADPYRYIIAANALQTDADNPSGSFERRPGHKNKYIGYAALTQFITPLNASVEGSYRFYHDTFGINAHTVSLAWYQKIGKQLVVSPSFRYYRQSAANFYMEMLPDFANPPQYFSPDYRLSEMQTFSYGINVSWRVHKHISLDASYKRYIMEGLDGVTSSTAYPSANVFTVGARLWF